MSTKVFFIKVLNYENKVAWVTDDLMGGWGISFDISNQLKSFFSFKDAEKFISDNKLRSREKKMRAIIISNKDIITYHKNNSNVISLKDGQEMFYIENKNGEKMFLKNISKDETEVSFLKTDVGFPCWYSRSSCEQIIKKCKLENVYIKVITGVLR